MMRQFRNRVIWLLGGLFLCVDGWLRTLILTFTVNIHILAS